MKKTIYLILTIITSVIVSFVFWPIKVGNSITNKQNEIWSHANNDIINAKINSEIFTGIEIDVVYDKNTNSLNVRHNVEDNPSDYFLFQLIDSTFHNNCSYWIDLKNLNSQNINEIINLFELYPAFKNNIIIESPNAKELYKFKEKGYYTSLWLPSYPNKFLSYFKFFIRTKPILIKCDFNAISAHQSMFPIINFFYKKHNIHLWTHDYNKESEIPKIKALREHKNIKVLLVDYKNPDVLN